MNKSLFIKGFTLIEMVISLAIFTIVALIAVGALLKIMDLNKKSLTMKTSINNLNFVLESMSREMRVGKNYTEVSNNSSGWEIRFQSPKPANEECYISYKYYSSLSTLRKAQRGDCSDTTGAFFADIISPDIKITNSILIMNTSSGQPYAFFWFKGYTGLTEKEKTEFSMQTRVSQRIK